MAANPSKFQLIFLGVKNSTNLCLDICGNIIISTSAVKLLGLKIDQQLNFVTHVKELCRKANNKVKAFCRVINYMDKTKAKLLFNTFFVSCFNYCPLIWMFCGRSGDDAINRVHLRALRTLHDDFSSSFQELLNLDNSVSVHHKNLQTLMTEIYKSTHHLNPQFMWDFFREKETPYNLRTNNLLKLPPTRTVSHGMNSLTFRGSIIWNTLPDNIKNITSLNAFKTQIKKWREIKCNCKTCS